MEQGILLAILIIVIFSMGLSLYCVVVIIPKLVIKEEFNEQIKNLEKNQQKFETDVKQELEKLRTEFLVQTQNINECIKTQSERNRSLAAESQLQQHKETLKHLQQALDQLENTIREPII